MADESTERPDSRTVLVRMRAVLPSLRPSERRIAQAFLDAPVDSADLSIADLAQQCGTSTTSVVRFYKRIGYAHYRDLRIDVAREATREKLAHAEVPPVSGDIDLDDTLDEVIAKVARNETLSIADTARTLDRQALAKAVELITAARRVDCFGVGASSLVALDLQRKLTRIGRTALNWPDSHNAWTSAATLDASCVVVVVSHSGETADTVEFLTLARAAGASSVAITNHEGSRLGVNADVTLTTAARETRFRAGALGSRIAQLMVVDCLFTGVAQASYDASQSALRSTYAAVRLPASDKKR
ncbi:MurR/RpiR family transcriptional regulator [Streptomyces sp. NPDC049881]|uniref:MurR/RpiR family transcriptional regulator n=1 Tax=unclassified Streptomyces TaxID=2593676 RepID=UPI0034388D00